VLFTLSELKRTRSTSPGLASQAFIGLAECCQTQTLDEKKTEENLRRILTIMIDVISGNLIVS